jgi:hypothetical protein
MREHGLYADKVVVDVHQLRSGKTLNEINEFEFCKTLGSRRTFQLTQALLDDCMTCFDTHLLAFRRIRRV